MPAVTIISKMKEELVDFQVDYMGSYGGIERKLIGDIQIPYKAISTGKLRRYLSLKNIYDFFRLSKGIIQSYLYLLQYSRKECLIFSIGGFVSVPVVWAAKLQRKKVYIHEQTSRMGLANRISSYFADKILVSFEASLQHFPKLKTVYVGYPVRKDCFSSRKKIFYVNDFEIDAGQKPILFITGGGNGAKILNEIIIDNREELKGPFQIIHQVGHLFEEEYRKFNDSKYRVLGFIDKGMIDLFKSADVVISRSGAGTVMELMACQKRSIFIPLKIAQRNEQFYNAKEAQDKMGSIIIEEDDLTSQCLFDAIGVISNSQSIFQVNTGHMPSDRHSDSISKNLNHTEGKGNNNVEFKNGSDEIISFFKNYFNSNF